MDYQISVSLKSFSCPSNLSLCRDIKCLTLYFNTRPPMQSLNSPHHAMGPSMSPVGSPYMSSSMGMSGGGMTQCMGNSVVGGATGISSRDYFGDPGSPRSRSAIDSKNYRRSYTHAKPPYR